MSTHTTRLRRAMTAVASAALLAGLLPAAASAATPTARDITDFACPTAEVPDPGFTDDDDTIHEHAIACIVWYDLAGGTSATRYSPSADVNRGQMATFLKNLVVAGGVAMPSNPPDAFDDDDGTTHETAINQLAALGVVSGTSSTRYSPHASVTRGQMATFLNNAYAEITGARLTSSQDYFTDDAGTTHEDNINAVAEAGIAAGKTSTTYAPHQPVLRDQMASFLARETDLLVEEGEIDEPVTLPADATLDQSSVRQGGKVTGKILTQEGVEVTSAKVAGCGLSEQALTLTGTANAFEFTIPVSQPVGTCTLTFTISRQEGDDVVDTEEISVTAVGSATDAPELVSVSFVSKDDSAGTTTLRYSFDEALNAAAQPDAAAFRLYDASADRRSAKSASVSGSTVTAVFDTSAYDNATTATVAHAAVEDGQNLPNPEGAFPLKTASFTQGVTAAPDLERVDRIDATTYTFHFDEAAYDVGDAGNYHLVFTDGTTASGQSFAETDAAKRDNTASRTILFDGDAVAGKTTARAYIQAGTVSDAEQDTNPLTPAAGNTNVRQADSSELAGGGATPYITAISIDAAENQIRYTFSRGVSVPKDLGGGTDAFVAYRADGTEVRSSDATASGNTVTATFGGDGDPIPATTVGASVDAGAVQATAGANRDNLPDELASPQTFKAGETAAPDLLGVTRSVSGQNSVVTFRFDAPVSTTGDANAEFVIYQQDGTRRIFELNATTGNDCSTDGNTVVCSAGSSSTAGQAIDSAVLAAVEAGAVDDPNNSTYTNYEASAPIS